MSNQGNMIKAQNVDNIKIIWKWAALTIFVCFHIVALTSVTFRFLVTKIAGSFKQVYVIVLQRIMFQWIGRLELVKYYIQAVLHSCADWHCNENLD